MQDITANNQMIVTKNEIKKTEIKKTCKFRKRQYKVLCACHIKLRKSLLNNFLIKLFCSNPRFLVLLCHFIEIVTLVKRFVRVLSWVIRGVSFLYRSKNKI